ncbi:hypothetical protein BJ878DRAFT_323692 [Calycina marina]|uniref:F-box domain-containing protein n=1 Tax=Calycina marina TaxID=1763456 RepID=A0A9P7YUR7_9HELO|nr:hypothetical protein BJ878DRAFT_323692 [Calycina marina]
MPISALSTELIQKIYEYAIVKDVLNLSQTSRKNHEAYLGRQVPILQKALYNSPYSPFPELIKLCFSDATNTIRKPVGTEVRRRYELDRVVRGGHNPNLTLAMIKGMVGYGEIAEQWAETYPQLRWRYDSNNRRLLHEHERTRIRKAIYQIWTYHNLFHNQVYCEFAPDPPRYGALHINDLRLRLARTWSTIDIVRQSELFDKVLQLLNIEIFPSNTMLQHRYAQHLPPKTLEKMAWGDDLEHRVLADTLGKLSPAEMLHLYQKTTTKSERLEYLISKGRWFLEHDSTFAITISRIVHGARYKFGQPAHEPPHLPSSLRRLTPPYVDLSDREVEYGIIDSCAADGEHYFNTHVYANDANPNGEVLLELDSTVGYHTMWLDENTDGEATSLDENADQDRDSSDEDSDGS